MVNIGQFILYHISLQKKLSKEAENIAPDFRVILIDASLSYTSVHFYFGIEN